MGKSPVREKLVMDGSVLFNCTYLYVNLLGNEAGRMIFDGDILVARNKGNYSRKTTGFLSNLLTFSPAK
jgi:hypothetical protein